MKTKTETLFSLPPGTAALPVEIAAQLSTGDGAQTMASRYDAEAKGATGNRKFHLKRCAEAARRMAGYMELSEKGSAVQATIQQDKGAASAQIVACKQQLRRAEDGLELANTAHREAREKITSLQNLLAEQAGAQDALVLSAQTAFETEMEVGDEKSQQETAERLLAVQAERDAAAQKRRAYELRLRGHEAVEVQRRDGISAANAAIAQAVDALRMAEVKVALIEWDEAANQSLAAYTKAAQALRACSDHPQILNGFADAAFWFSSRGRSVSPRNTLTTRGDDGPVLMAGGALHDFLISARYPDLSVSQEETPPASVE